MEKKSNFRSSEFKRVQLEPVAFVSDTPITRPFEPGQARKTAGHSTEGKFREAHDCWMVFRFFSPQEKLVQDNVI